MPAKTSVKIRPRKPSSFVAEEAARARLLQAAFLVFAQHGFEAATTRMVAAEAKVNLAAIPYYFGGKEGLYHAVVQSMVDRIQEHMRPGIEAARALLTKEAPARDEIINLLAAMLPGPITIFAGPMGPYVGMIIAREQQQPTSAFTILYDGYVRIVHELGTKLVARYLSIEDESPEAIIRTHALAGQMFVFLGARATILRRLGKEKFNEEDVQLIQRVLAEQVRATLKGLDLLASQSKETSL